MFENRIEVDDIIKSLDEGKGMDSVGIEVLPRLPISDKIYLIEGYKDEESEFNGIAEECTSIYNGLKKVDYGMKEVIIVTTVIGNYSNINVDTVGLYDKVIGSGIYSYILSGIEDDDIDVFFELLENNIEQNVNLYNSTMAFLDRKISEFINKIPDENAMAKIVKEVKNISPKKIAELKGIVEKYTGMK